MLAANLIFFVRVHTHTHDYILYHVAGGKGYLIQANQADCMKGFSFTQWMNIKKSKTPIDILKHITSLGKIFGQVIKTGNSGIKIAFSNLFY